jgi:WD40 repeat protein
MGKIKIYNSSLYLIGSFQSHSGYIKRIKQSPFNTNYVATSLTDHTVKIWSTSNWTLIRAYLHERDVYALEWLDTDTLASCGIDSEPIEIWAMSTGQTRLSIAAGLSIWSLKLLNNKIHLAAGLYNGDINIYNINDGSLVSSLQGHTSTVWDLLQISDELLASAGGYDQTVRIWNLTTNECKFNLTGHTDWVMGLKQITFDLLASGSYDATIKLWNTTSGELIRTLTNHTRSIEWSLDLITNYSGEYQTLLVSGGLLDKTIKVWNWTNGECLNSIQTDTAISSMAVLKLIESKKR